MRNVIKISCDCSMKAHVGIGHDESITAVDCYCGYARTDTSHGVYPQGRNPPKIPKPRKKQKDKKTCLATGGRNFVAALSTRFVPCVMAFLTNPLPESIRADTSFDVVID